MAKRNLLEKRGKGEEEKVKREEIKVWKRKRWNTKEARERNEMERDGRRRENGEERAGVGRPTRKWCKEEEQKQLEIGKRHN